MPTGKHWRCSWNPPVPHHQTLRSFQRDTEIGTKVLRYWEVLQRGDANECLWATKTPRVTRSGTYGKGKAPLKGCIGLLLILNIMHNSAKDRRWARWQSKTPPARKSALLTTLLEYNKTRQKEKAFIVKRIWIEVFTKWEVYIARAHRPQGLQLL